MFLALGTYTPEGKKKDNNNNNNQQSICLGEHAAAKFASAVMQFLSI